MKKDLTLDRLRAVMSYSAETGLFTNLVMRSPRAVKGQISKALDKDGYIQIHLDGAMHRGHRLAWFYTYGERPKSVIDHINGDRTDNRIVNLRDVSISENSQNVTAARSDNKTGVLGVSFDKSRNRFSAQIFVGGKKLNLGRFKTVELAGAAYLSAKRALHTGAVL